MLKTTSVSVAIVGATGLVGQEFLSLLDERRFPVGELRLFASHESRGKKITFRGKDILCQELKPGCFEKCQVAFFSAGASVSKEWGPQAVKEGCFVVDNSSAFRMDPHTPLIVPEVNGPLVRGRSKDSSFLIANPNCSTIQLVVTLKPLHDAFGLKSVIVSTYQSVSGAGREAVEELSHQTACLLNGREAEAPKVLAHPIAFNNLPHIDKFDQSGFTFEEKKIMGETQKILSLPSLDISATAVRTPTFNSHSEAVWAELGQAVERTEILRCLEKAPGLQVMDDPEKNIYPLNREASGKDDVFVGRIRRDLKNPSRWLMWIVADNIRKGAALNGIQIAELLFFA